MKRLLVYCFQISVGKDLCAWYPIISIPNGSDMSQLTHLTLFKSVTIFSLKKIKNKTGGLKRTTAIPPSPSVALLSLVPATLSQPQPGGTWAYFWRGARRSVVASQDVTAPASLTAFPFVTQAFRYLTPHEKKDEYRTIRDLTLLTVCSYNCSLSVSCRCQSLPRPDGKTELSSIRVTKKHGP